MRQELDVLLAALIDGQFDAAQQERLGAILRADAEARDLYLDYSELHADLALRGGAGDVLPQVQPAGAIRSASHHGGTQSRYLLWAGLVMAGVVAGLLIALALPGSKPESRISDTAAEPTDASVAVLLQAPGAAWEASDLPTRPGAPLAPGWLRLKSGFAHIEFYSGATVILEGPAEFQLISRMEAFCAKGKLRATVPQQAEGFTIGSPNTDLVDRGTEFGLDVNAERTEVQVFQGKVELHDRGATRIPAAHQSLTTGQGLRLDGPDRFRAMRANPDAFLSARDLATRASAETQRWHEGWLRASEELRRDQSLVVYYPFQPEQPWSRTLLDQARGRKKANDGVIVGCSWAEGRGPAKQGLEFRRVSDRVRFNVPGEFENLTLMAWVRLDALPNRFNSLFMTDGWDEAAPHWHISDTGKLELGVQGPNRKGGVHYYSDEVFTPDRLGQWTHLAVVHDRAAGHVTHYVDGVAVTREPIKLELKLRLGDAEIGNWNVEPLRAKNPVRNFTGCIDEFMLFGRALSEKEVQTRFEQGRPRP